MNCIDNRMSQYINTETKQVIVLMNTAEKIGDKYVRKDLYKPEQSKPAVEVKPPAPVVKK